jgi:RNA polymerase sigma-70 factor (ECF subfamily)
MSTLQVTQRRDLESLGDEALVSLARARDEVAIRVIVRRHNQRLFRAARAIVRDDSEAEDIVQASYVRAFTHLDSFRGDAQLSTWLTRIALNEALGRLRKRRPVADLDEVEAAQSRGAEVIPFPGASVPADPESEMHRSQMRHLLERAVDALPDGFRAVFVLRDVEGLTIEETASQLAIKPETVKSRLHRARRLLRAAITTELSGAFNALYPFDGARCVGMADRVITELRARQS